MESVFPVSIETMDEMVSSAVEKVFSTMLGGSASLDSSSAISSDDGQVQAPLPRECPIVVGSVGFIGGLNGVIYLFFEEEHALALTATFLGMEAHELAAEGNETVNDALGELTNMIVGTYKNQLSDHGVTCRLTVPSILRGNSFCIETTSSVLQRLYRFSTGGKEFAAELFMKPGE